MRGGGVTHRVVIFDDNSVQAQDLLERVNQSRFVPELLVEIVSDSADLKHILSMQFVDILLMDINIGDEMSGIEFIQQYVTSQSHTEVIYVTGFDEYHSKVYRTTHTGFLLKPVKQADLDEALEIALRRIEKTREKPFLIQIGGRKKKINPSVLRYVESHRRILRLHIGDECLETYEQLGVFMQQLPASFVQCHKSYAVNMAYIDELTRTEAVLLTGERIPVSQSRTRSVHSAFEAYVAHSI